MIPDASVLRGMPYARAKAMGTPHWGAYYVKGTGDYHRLEDGARCIVCGRPAENAHHVTPKGMGGANREWMLKTPMGCHILRPALVALCGSGTTGCHGRVHAGRVNIWWEWDSDEDEEEWWDGTTLAHVPPHSPELYRHGCWVVRDLDNDTKRMVRKRW